MMLIFMHVHTSRSLGLTVCHFTCTSPISLTAVYYFWLCLLNSQHNIEEKSSMRTIFQILLLLSSTILCQEYKTYDEIIEYVNGKLDFILMATQKTIHSVSDLITQSALQDTVASRLSVCSNQRVLNSDNIQTSTLEDDVQQFILSVEVTKNSIDRLVMNGSRNVTAKCELITDEKVFVCLNEATEEISNISHTLLDRLQSVLVKFKQSICRESIELL